MITFEEFIAAGSTCELNEDPPAELIGYRQEDWEKIDRLVRHYNDNKKLFEAAPELLEALQSLLSADDELDYPGLVAKAERAIAKAGQAPAWKPATDTIAARIDKQKANK